MVAYHLSRMEGIQPDDVPINDDFPYEKLLAHLEENLVKHATAYDETETNEAVKSIYTKNKTPWFADFVNYLAAGVLPPDLTY